MILAILAQRSSNPLKRIVAYLVVLFALLTMVYENREVVRRNSVVNQKQGIRVMQWNIWGGRMGAERLSSIITRQNPDIVCFNEPKRVSEKQIPDYARHFPGAWNTSTSRNEVVYSKFPVQRETQFLEDMVLGLYVQYPRISILFVDIPAFAGMSRNKAFEIVMRHMRINALSPDLILGDFNTPADAFSLKALLDLGYRDSYLLAGHGLGYTWATLFPMLRIDMILAGSKIRVVQYQKRFTRLSDHAWHWVDVEVQHPN